MTNVKRTGSRYVAKVYAICWQPLCDFAQKKLKNRRKINIIRNFVLNKM